MHEIEFERCAGKTIKAIQLSTDFEHMVIVFTDDTFCSIGISGSWQDYDCNTFFRNEEFKSRHFDKQVMAKLGLTNVVPSKSVVFPVINGDDEVIGVFTPSGYIGLSGGKYPYWAISGSEGKFGNVTCKKCGTEQSFSHPHCPKCCPHDELEFTKIGTEYDDDSYIEELGIYCPRCITDFDVTYDELIENYKVVKK